MNIHEQAVSYCRQLNYALKSVVFTDYNIGQLLSLIFVGSGYALHLT
jgi:hypothetical protein